MTTFHDLSNRQLAERGDPRRRTPLRDPAKGPRSRDEVYEDCQ